MTRIVPNTFSIFFPQYRPFPSQFYYTSAVSTAVAYSFPTALPVVYRGRVSASPLGQTSVPVNFPVQFYML